MAKRILFFLVFFHFIFNFNSSAQSDSIKYLWNEISSLKILNNQLIQREQQLQLKIDNQQMAIDSICTELGISNASFQNTADSLRKKIDVTETGSNEKYQKLGKSLNINIILLIASFVLLIGLVITIFLLIRKKQQRDKVEVFDKIASTKKAMDAESVKLDLKFMELIEKQLILFNEEKELKTSNDSNTEPDHSLALKVADNIARIQMNLANMDQGTKGLKQLNHAVNSVIDNFKANGYEIIDLLNKPYNEGMKLVANMEPDDKLKPNEQIIKRIIKPQVNYMGKMIQAAQVVVAYGE